MFMLTLDVPSSRAARYHQDAVLSPESPQTGKTDVILLESGFGLPTQPADPELGIESSREGFIPEFFARNFEHDR
jgi:hypothetical protein